MSGAFCRHGRALPEHTGEHIPQTIEAIDMKSDSPAQLGATAASSPTPRETADMLLCAYCGKDGAAYQMDSAIPYCDEACFEADNDQEGDDGG